MKFIRAIIDWALAAGLIAIIAAVVIGVIIAITWPFWVGLWAIVNIF